MLHQSYFRRSRTGCKTCKNSRVKCDERHPHCLRCEKRNLPCGGYAKDIRWVQPSSPSKGLHRIHNRAQDLTSSSSVDTHHHVNATEMLQAESIARLTLPPSLCFTNPYDRLAYDHLQSGLKHVTCVDPHGSQEIHSALLSLTFEPESTFLMISLAHAAHHMYTLGIIPQTVAIQMSTRALNGMRRAIHSVKLSKNPSKVRPASQEDIEHLEPYAFNDQVITGAIMLASADVFRASNTRKLVPMMRGAATLIKERFNYSHCKCSRSHPNRSDFSLDRIVYRSSVTVLAYLDVLTALPCPRAPILEGKYWHQYVQSKKNHDVSAIYLDPWLGYCGPVLAALGECSEVLERWFTEQMTEDEYLQEKWEMFLRLDEAQHNLPPQIDPRRKSNATPSYKERAKLHNECVSAAIAHSLAGKIFVLRATDFSQDSQQICGLASKLEEAVDGVPTDSTAVTMMLWPLWVLGCESYEGTLRRSCVVQRLEGLYAKEHIFNIKAALEVLQNRIWALDCGTQWQQAAWVKYCWDMHITMNFA